MGALAEVKEVFSIVESAATIIAVVVGGVWVYFKFVKDRVYRPRLDLSVDAGTLAVGKATCMVCRLSVTNIGTSKVRLVQKGSGLRLSSDTTRSADFEEPNWNSHGVFETLVNHRWFESGETIHDEVVVFLPSNPNPLFLVEARLVCKMPRRNITIYTRQVVPLSREWRMDYPTCRCPEA